MGNPGPGLPKSQGKHPVVREGVDIAKLMLTTPSCCWWGCHNSFENKCCSFTGIELTTPKHERNTQKVTLQSERYLLPKTQSLVLSRPQQTSLTNKKIYSSPMGMMLEVFPFFDPDPPKKTDHSGQIIIFPQTKDFSGISLPKSFVQIWGVEHQVVF